MMVDRFSLQPLSAARVERIEHWFDNPEVRHRLGDRSWIHRELRRSMSLAYVVYPARWRRGFGTATLKALLDHPDVSDVELFFCGVDADNLANRRLATSAGFHLVDPHPDHEDILYFRYERVHGVE